MRSILSTLTLQELFIILNSIDTEDLPKLFTQQQYAILMQELTPYGARATVSISNEALIPALLAAANPIDFLWTLTSLISLGSAFVPISIAFLGFTVILICAFFYQNQQELQVKKCDISHYLQLSALQILAGDLILEKIFSAMPSKIVHEGHAEDYVVEMAFAKANQSAKTRRITAPLIPAFSVFFSISTTIFISYLWGLSSIFEAAGYVEISTAMVSLTGLGIIALIGISIGLFFAVDHFLDHYTQERMQFARDALQDQVSKLQLACRERYTKYEFMQLLQAEIQSHEQTLHRQAANTDHYEFQMFKPSTAEAGSNTPSPSARQPESRQTVAAY